MEQLTINLAKKLYNTTDPLLAEYESCFNVVYYTPNAVGLSNDNWKEENANEDTELDDLRYRIAKSMFCLEDWVRWKNREYSDEGAASAVEDRFNNGYIGKTQDGWAYIDDDTGDRCEKEEQEIKVNGLGHVFTFWRSKFWQHCREAPDDLRKALTAFAVSHPPAQPTSGITLMNFEVAFFTHELAAFSWQEQYSDEDDEDRLTTLLRLLRRLVEAEL